MKQHARWKKWVLIVWAVALVFGLSFETSHATALDSSCIGQCNDDCGRGNCDDAIKVGCSCYWQCSDGSTGSSICTQ